MIGPPRIGSSLPQRSTLGPENAGMREPRERRSIRTGQHSRAELDALKAELKRLRREAGRGAAMARIQADSGPGDDAPAFTREEFAEAWGIRE